MSNRPKVCSISQKSIRSIDQEHITPFLRSVNQEGTLLQNPIEGCIVEAVTEGKLWYRSSWYSKCSQSFSYGEEIDDANTGRSVPRKSNKVRYEPLHVKLQRYKTFHGSSRREQTTPNKQLHRQNLHLFQVLHHGICCAP